MNNEQMKLNSSPHGSPHGQFKIEITGDDIWSHCDAIVLCSGGMDSVTLAHYVKKELGMSPVILFFNYGQKTLMREWAYAMMCSNDLFAPLIIVHMSDFAKFVKSAITAGGQESDKAEDTVVPGRNMMMMSFAVSLAQSSNIEDVYIGVQLGDNEGYPDCRPQFWKYITEATKNAYEVNVRTPFASWSKKDIVKVGIELGVDYNNTWSCYYSNKEPCGKCPSCQVRKEAFK